MIPNTNLYKSSRVLPAHSRADVEVLLEKFGVKKFAWKRDDPQTSYMMFARDEDFTGENHQVTYKVTIPFIEKKNRSSLEYDEIRSYRILYHVLKALLLNTDVGMSFEQSFGNYIVIGKLPNSNDPMSVGDKLAMTIAEKGMPALEFTQ